MDPSCQVSQRVFSAIDIVEAEESRQELSQIHSITDRKSSGSDEGKGLPAGEAYLISPTSSCMEGKWREKLGEVLYVDVTL